MKIYIEGFENFDDISSVMITTSGINTIKVTNIPMEQIKQLSTPHGRLIDADALPKDMFLDTPIVLQKDIDNAPTILEAEQ